MRRQPRRAEREPTVALINIVFLMLVFFLVAGQIAAPVEPDLRLVRVEGAENAPPGDVLVVHADGRLSHRGRPVASAAAHLAALPEIERQRVRLMPDRELPALRLVAIARELTRAGAGTVVIVSGTTAP
ncbi:biopolymer transport protein ExbD [Meinhardsimonia xiamenensis]|jgi:biopolymer transport protein ExbD|uniref:Biopolymer transport protein ExbD n=1 Tax=Meinhardsimonia xiamenensis TaxID=990712 RepID=A0A1G9ENP7_9RHOB|nr:biopolymer transporter ExbD [Meinhardsimonia xiamenensis]PRX33691.1 biopolymer transport protein ExbD [Meinhardsimonia xiamenensis]SDK77750.1 biopolymer transport protein ExbD [Meinhardsimonia xiamenensis]